MIKKLIIVIISIAIITVFFILFRGTDKKYIADYMPSMPSITEETTPPWKVVKKRATIDVMIGNLIINLIIISIESIILFKSKVFEKNLLSVLLIIALLIIPCIISAIVTSKTFAYTS